jgi:hypothetical protein
MSLKKIIERKERKKNHFIWSGVEIFIKDPISNPEISIGEVFSRIEKEIPKHLLGNLDSIYIGDFGFLKEREIQAAYENSSIFVTNEQDDQDDICDDIIHEIAHSVEEIYQADIYADGFLEKEFTEKRKQLYTILKSEGFEAELITFLNSDYDKNFDDFLYMEVGYPILTSLSHNLFYSPYGMTSLREYFANGFEAFYHHDAARFLKNICPTLHKKLYKLMEEDHE